MGDPATIGYTDPTGKQREIKVPGSGAITPKNATEEQVLRSFEGTDVLRGNTVREIGARRASPRSSTRRSTKRSTRRAASPKTQAETKPAAETEG